MYPFETKMKLYMKTNGIEIKLTNKFLRWYLHATSSLAEVKIYNKFILKLLQKIEFKSLQQSMQTVYRTF